MWGLGGATLKFQIKTLIWFCRFKFYVNEVHKFIDNIWKVGIYETKSNDIEKLKERICDVIDSISPYILKNVSQLYISLAGCEAQAGSHFLHLVA